MWTREGWLYLAAVEDLYTRKIVGWSTSNRWTTNLVTEALKQALDRQLPAAGLLAHSDRGSQYASEAYQRLLQVHGITCSMSRKGNCWDNAPRGSFFATLNPITGIDAIPRMGSIYWEAWFVYTGIAIVGASGR